MLIEILKWISKHFVPYLIGVLVGIGFFFLFVRMLPILPEASVFSWPSSFTSATVTSVFNPQPETPKNVATETNATQQATTETEVTQKAADPEDPISQNVHSDTEQKVSTPTETKPPAGESMIQTAEENKSLPATPKQSLPVFDKPSQLSTHEVPAQTHPKEGSCGTPPDQPGRTMDQYLACQWRNNCLNRLSRARKMILRDKMLCPANGINAQSCLAYYHSLENQYHPALCNSWPAFQGPRGW